MSISVIKMIMHAVVEFSVIDVVSFVTIGGLSPSTA